MNKSNNFFYKFTNFLLSITIALFLISLSVNITLSFKKLYYLDIDYLNISKNYGMQKEEIIKNYDILIDYLKNKNITKLNMPSFKTSKEGEIHFAEVKNIFIKFNTIMYITFFLSLFGIFYKIKKRNFKFLKLSSIFLISIPILLSVPFAINFDKSFTIFHKIFFNNDYWEFDPELDPIINVLPEEFFFHCAIFILAILSIFSIILYLSYIKIKRHHNEI
ncbi:integral membrane protein TIGR01906 [Clostridium sp. USBA 49]|jgi:integral membrane protein (TIGR01906 family)|uniref:TIGR01906 family membrane protein n=1 Tax=Clostridium sp. USBA 49 TaxID=1881060 RepID=UPI00099A8936|nr:TIGR01906 family membrane protein [Clostridium sp. USBA 49]SKA80406.1 integral membrane protein TIGR01906 [Clostridium sp. USBA 49]